MLMLDATLVKRASQAPSAAQVSASTKNDNIGNSYRHSPIFSIAKAGTSGGFFTLGLHAGIRGGLGIRLYCVGIYLP